MRRYKKWSLNLVVPLLLASSVQAQVGRDMIVEEMYSEQRVALVIGNGAYDDAPLRNPPNDARAIAQVLERRGFSVTRLINADKKGMFTAVRDFGRSIQRGGVGVFYYAGHGLQVQGRNYLVPVGTNIQAEDEVEFECIDAGLVLNKMESAGNRVNIVILDACRNNPFARSFRSSGRGLGQMDAATGSLLAYATAPGSVAADGEGNNGLYTSKLLKYIEEPGLTVERVFKFAGGDVENATEKAQQPWVASSLRGDFYFVLPEKEDPALTLPVAVTGQAAVSRPQVTGPPPPLVQTLGHLQVNVNVAQAQVFVDDQYKGQANPGVPLNIENLGLGPVQVRVQASNYAPSIREILLTANEWVQPPLFRLRPLQVQAPPPPLQVPGQSTLASTQPPAGINHNDLEDQVTVPSTGLRFDKYEVTNVQFANFLNLQGNRDQEGVTWLQMDSPDALIERRAGQFVAKAGYEFHPVVEVSWYGAQSYCTWAGKRLPSEEEWVAACKGEQNRAYPWGASAAPTRANYGIDRCCAADDRDGFAHTSPVGQYPEGASPEGVMDLAGNVWEWLDQKEGEMRVFRGGSWKSSPKYLGCGKAARSGKYPIDRIYNVGFRCVQ
ncbi:MAG: SUMF1/EgtB/PvdO family nonheme iron enzyme [Candidatus Latescibacteria bacterium]|nr:SUMF1/EgtB/PvdO family nonheme iron enzyme [Candidatus Latescibacterota bacterium]